MQFLYSYRYIQKSRGQFIVYKILYDLIKSNLAFLKYLFYLQETRLQKVLTQLFLISKLKNKTLYS